MSIVGRLAWITLTVALAGCSAAAPSVGSLRCESRGEEAVYLPAEYETVVFAREEDGQTLFVLTDIPDDAILDGSATTGQIMHVELLWEPKGGVTPLEESATNVCIRHLVIVNGELGLYGGAGFARPAGKPNKETWSIDVRDASMRLLESTDGFHDPFGPARLVGRFTAAYEPGRARRLHRGMSQLATDALQRSRLVQASSPQKNERPG